MDILYIVGKGFSEWRDNELRYSLRSIAKNGKNIRKVFVVGYCPYWLNEETVTLLPLRDPVDGNKHANILRAIDYAINNSDIEEHFLISADDHYYVAPTDFDKYPIYWRGEELQTAPVKGRDKWYNTTLISTQECLSAMGLPTRMYCWHGNTHFNARLWKQKRMVLLRRLAVTLPEACEPTCLMLNYWQAVEPKTMPKIVERDDWKISVSDTTKSVADKIRRKECVTSTNVVGEALKEFLIREFPNPCKYERTPR